MSDESAATAPEERRKNPELRTLIDEMLDRVREIHRSANAWNPDERARAEVALEQIMARVRQQAGSKGSAQPQDSAEGGKE